MRLNTHTPHAGAPKHPHVQRRVRLNTKHICTRVRLNTHTQIDTESSAYSLGVEVPEGRVEEILMSEAVGVRQKNARLLVVQRHDGTHTSSRRLAKALGAGKGTMRCSRIAIVGRGARGGSPVDHEAAAILGARN